MPTMDDSAHRRQTLVVVRWVLIAVCASLIVFSDKMVGRAGFAALLVLAIIVGRYASRRRSRATQPERRGLPSAPVQQPSASDTELPRREAGH